MSQSTRFVILGLTLLTLIGSASIGPASAQSEAPASDPAPEPEPVGAFVPLAPGPVIVVLTSGEQLRGELVEDRPGSVMLKVAEIDVRIPRDRIESVYPENDLMERYRLLRESIPPNDADQILFLAEWLRRNAMLDEALNETRAALKVDPTNSEAIRMRKLIEQQIRMRDHAGDRDRNGSSSAPTGKDRPRPGKRQTRDSFPLISEKDANLIKVYEVDLNNPPRMLISDDTIDMLLDRYGGRLGVPASREGRATFHRKPPAEILAAMYRLRARDLYPEVRVLELPESLKMFRDTVNSTWLVNSCATTRCHGGTDAGRLMLANRKPSADQSFLTNFLILDRFRLADGTPLINYESPEMSPLLQMTIPQHESLFPHPKVKRWRPVFTNANSRRYQQAVRWIESMYRPRPTYPIEYEPPTGRSSAAPDAGTGDSLEPDDAPIER